MAITLLDTAAIEQKPLKKAVLMAMFKGRLPSPVDFLPIENAKSLAQEVTRLTDPGTPSTRNIGEAVAAYAAVFTRGQETLKIIENKITIDKVLLDVQTYIEDPIALQTRTYSLVIKNTVNNLLVNGDPSADASDPAGLQYRLVNDAMFLAQAVNAAALDVDANDATRNSWVDYIDEAITLCGGGAPDLAVINRQTWIKFRSALRNLKVLDTTKDQFDRMIMQYGNTKFLDAGNTPAGALSSAATGQVILNDGSTSSFGTANSTPMFFLSTAEEGVRLLQLHPLRITKVGLDPGDPGQFVVDVTWPIGFLIPQKFALSSVQGLDIS